MAIYISKDFKKKIGAIFLPPILYIFTYILYLTCKRVYHFDKSKISPKESIFVFWHGELLMLIFGYKNYRNSNNIDTIISEHNDGEIIHRVLKLFGGGSIRGSSTRGGIKALKGAFKKNAPIITMRVKASRQWYMKSWDKFSIPKPFCRLDFYYSDPFYVSGYELEDAKNMIKKRLDENAF